jgi:biopolymer transport protein ExbD
MQMNSGTSLNSEINVTPLVDVVLVLLIIFMVVVPLLLQGYDVGMPRPSVEGAPPPADVQLVLSIRPETCRIEQPPPGDGLPSDCHVNLAGRDVPVAELPGAVALIMSDRPADQHVMFLAADDRVNYEGVLRIVDLARSGVDDLKIEFLTTN